MEFVDPALLRNRFTHIQAAKEFREDGNRLFKNKEYLKAIECYTSAIQANDMDAQSMNNRALCYFLLHDFENALHDSMGASCCDPTFIKPYYRRAACHIERREYCEAEMIVEEGLAKARSAGEREREELRLLGVKAHQLKLRHPGQEPSAPGECDPPCAGAACSMSVPSEH